MRTTRPCPREASAVQASAGEAPGKRTQSGKGDDGGHAAYPIPQQKDKCRATCQRRACDVLTPEKGQRGRPPLPTPNSHTHRGKGRGQRGDGEGTWGMTVAGSGSPPEDTATGWGGSGTIVRDEPHDLAQRGHAPCKPQRGDHRGCYRRKGRVTTGATRQAPPPPSRGTSAAPRACAVLTTCLRNGADSEDAPPPPPPSSPPSHKKGEDSEETARGHGGGQRTQKKNNKGHQHARAGADSGGKRDMAGARGHG